MESMAAAAGVSKGLGYAYFQNSDDLLSAVLDQELATFEERISTALRSQSSFEEQVTAAVSAWFDCMIERGGLLVKLLTIGDLRISLRDKRAVFYRRIEAYFAALAVKEFALDIQRVEIVIAVLIGGMPSLLERLREAKDSRTTLEETFVSLVMTAISGTGATPLSC